MESPTAAITVRSRREAMDLSLVLASQGIDHVIEQPDEEHGWRVLLDARRYETGVTSWRAYRAENRRGPWQQPLPFTGMVFDWRGVVWFALLAVLFALEQLRFPALRDAGLMHNAAVREGEWWRLFTAVTLHGDVAHLVANFTTGALLLGLAMGSFGPGVALLASFLCGAGGNLAGLLFQGPEHRSLGASGMVMGALGLLAGQSVAMLRSGESARQLIVRGLLGGFLLLVLLGLDPHTDVLGHVGGFVSGLALGGLLGLAGPQRTQTPLVNRAAEVLCGGLVVLTWWLALRTLR
jgi:rhomboid protease GluP